MFFKKKEEPILLGDLGGTYIRLAIRTGKNRFEFSIKEKCTDYQCLEDALRAYFRKIGFQPRKACFAVAGVFKNGRIALSNNPWIIVREELEQTFQFQSLILVNDFVAQALSSPFLEDVLCLKQGNADKNFPLLVMGPGTGLGVSVLSPDGKTAFPSEAGHMSFAPENEEETALFQFVMKRYGHVSVERLISGRGLSVLYEFKSGHFAEPEEVSSLALSGDETAKSAIILLMNLLGSAAGNFVLAFNAFQGVYFSGGLLQQKGMLSYLKESDFEERFSAKGRMDSLLKNVPVYSVRTPLSAFIGLQTLAEQTERK